MPKEKFECPGQAQESLGARLELRYAVLEKCCYPGFLPHMADRQEVFGKHIGRLIECERASSTMVGSTANRLGRDLE